MAETRKILAQSAPTGGVLTDVYTVPALTQAVVSTLTICNRGGIQSSFRVSVAVTGAANTNSQYLYYDIVIDAYDTFAATVGITLGPADVVRMYSSNSNLTINLFGVEIV
jgi:hypothetical protein